MEVIDLFSGCGGLSLGFIKAGYIVKKAVEFDRKIADIYKKNHPSVDVIIDDIKNIDKTNIFKKGDAEVIIGGPPCQGFSMAGARIREGFIDDPRNYLFKHYYNIVKTVKPKVFIMENVKGLLTIKEGKIFDEIKNIFKNEKEFEGKPYQVYHKIVRAIEFGIPQKRERVIIIGTTIKNIDINKLWDLTIENIQSEYPEYFNTVSVKDAISNLPQTTSNGIINNPVPITNYQKYLSSCNDILYNHTKTNHTKLAVNRMEKINSGENFKVLDDNIKSVHSGSYGRLCWDEQAPTITTRFDTPAGGRFIHPEENRTLTPREAARIQSFPDDFIFVGNKTTICKTIGNAVPPKIAYFLAKFVKNMIEIGEDKNESNITI